jgi:membrane carboxypeptidase/penicillin-binding protein
VWVGTNDHSARQNVDGITGAAPIWHDFMEQVSASLPVQNFIAPAGITAVSVCPDGTIAEGWITGITEVFPSDAIPTSRCLAPLPPMPDPGTPPTSPDAQAVIDDAQEFFRRAREKLDKPPFNTQPLPQPLTN